MFSKGKKISRQTMPHFTSILSWSAHWIWDFWVIFLQGFGSLHKHRPNKVKFGQVAYCGEETASFHANAVRCWFLWWEQAEERDACTLELVCHFIIWTFDCFYHWERTGQYGLCQLKFSYMTHTALSLLVNVPP